MVKRFIYFLRYLLLLTTIILLISGCSGKSTILTGTITGTIVLEGKQDYSGALVTLVNGNLSGTTDGSGYFSISSVAGGTATLIITKDGYASRSQTTAVEAGKTSNVGNITLSSTHGEISGTANLEGEVTYSGIRVSIENTGFNTTTNASGEYNFTNMAPGTATLNFTKSGYENASALLTILQGVTNNASSVTLNISSSVGAIFGTVKINGVAASGVTVYLSGTSSQAESNTNGQFAFSLLPVGTYILVYSYSGYSSQTKSVVVTLGTAVDAGVVDLASGTAGSGTISGTIDLYSDQDDSGVLVEVSTSLSATTDSNGNFTITDVPLGTYTLTISKSGYATANETNVNITSGSSINISKTLYRIFHVLNEYNLSSYGITGTPYSMTYFWGYLYIATDEGIYRVSTGNLSVVNSSVVTNNYKSLLGLKADNVITTQDIMFGIKRDPEQYDEYFYYDPGLTFYEKGTGDGGIVLSDQAITYYNPGYSITVYYSGQIYMFYTGMIGSSTDIVTQNILSINESGLTGLFYSMDTDLFYASNNSNIYIYRYNGLEFVLNKSQPYADTGAGTTCTDITFDGQYIWTIDGSGKLYKHLNNW